ncbi:hypothetical protein RYD26_03465 [Pasteurellaceae bacterium LIM206]|nr:hypothetical protein [Pasteurellaceae bacterium LIM206]
MKNLIAVLCMTIGLTACVSTELSTQNKTFDKATDSRIRVYGQNGRPTLMELDINGKHEKISIGGGLGQAFSSMLHMKDNESIGMPATELSKDPSAYSQFVSAIFFKEFVIPAGGEVKVRSEIMSIPVTSVATNIVGNTIYKTTTTVYPKGCKGNEIIFIPQAGHDYEVAPIAPGNHCNLTITDITQNQ